MTTVNASFNTSEYEDSVYDYFTDPEDRFPEYESAYYADNITVVEPSHLNDAFNTPIAWWLSLFLAVVATISMGLIVYRSNERAKRERYERAQQQSFEIDVADIERDESQANVNGTMRSDDSFTLDAPKESDHLKNFSI